MYSFRAVIDGKTIARSLKTKNPETAAAQAMVYTNTHGGEDAGVECYRVYLYSDGAIVAASAGYGWHLLDKSLPTAAFYNEQ